MSRPEPRTSAYLLRPGRNVEEYEIFISSGDDLRAQRERLEVIINNVNTQARDAGARYRFSVRRWEHAPSRRTHGDGNFEFRHDAENAHLVIVLLHDDLRNGTREEIEAAMECSTTQVAVIWMSPPPITSRKRSNRLLRKAMEDLQDDVRWMLTGDPGSDASVDTMISIVTRTLIDIAARNQEPEGGPYSEER